MTSDSINKTCGKPPPNYALNGTTVLLPFLGVTPPYRAPLALRSEALELSLIDERATLIFALNFGRTQLPPRREAYGEIAAGAWLSATVLSKLR